MSVKVKSNIFELATYFDRYVLTKMSVCQSFQISIYYMCKQFDLTAVGSKSKTFEIATQNMYILTKVSVSKFLLLKICKQFDLTVANL